MSVKAPLLKVFSAFGTSRRTLPRSEKRSSDQFTEENGRFRFLVARRSGSDVQPAVLIGRRTREHCPVPSGGLVRAVDSRLDPRGHPPPGRRVRCRVDLRLRLGGGGLFLIGLLLMGFALALAWENKRLLLGESLPEVDGRRLRRIVEEWEGVVHVDGFRTVYFGPDQVLVTADVSFDPDLDTGEIDDHISAIERRLKDAYDGITKVYIEPET
jgi:hypothetical protein